MDIMNRAVIEAASWRLASTLVRRHPHLTLFEMHPAGSTYDVLCLRSDNGAEIMLNRKGTIQIHGREDGEPADKQPIEWLEYLSAPNPAWFAERIEYEAALPPAELDLPTRPAVVYNLIAAIAGLGALGHPFKITQGFFDSSGQFGSCDADWWREMQLLAPDLTKPFESDLFGIPGYRFWRVERSDFQITFETSTGKMWQAIDFDLDDLAEDLANDPDQVFEEKYDTYAGYDIANWTFGDQFEDRPYREVLPWGRPSMDWPPSDSEDANNDYSYTLRLLREVLEFGSTDTSRRPMTEWKDRLQ